MQGDETKLLMIFFFGCAIAIAIMSWLTSANSNRSNPIRFAQAVAPGIGLIAIGYGFSAAFSPQHDKTITSYFHLVGEGRSAEACALLDEYGQGKLKEGWPAPTCEAAMTKLRASLTPTDLRSLANANPSVKSGTFSGRSKQVQITSGNPLRMYTVDVIDRDGYELITGWR